MTDLRTDEFVTLQLHVRRSGLQGFHHLLRLLLAGDIFLQRHANQHFISRTEVLYLRVLIADTFQTFTNAVQICRLAVFGFHQSTTGKFDGEMQTFGEQKEHRQQKGNQ